MSRGLFVTGTDTGAGKTVVACAVVRGLRDRGLDVGVMKPIETGVDPNTGPLDANALRAAAGEPDPLDRVCPLQFALPAAPNVAAASEGRGVDLARVHRVYEELALQHDWMVVEGAGGLLVPTTDDATMADLARDLEQCPRQANHGHPQRPAYRTPTVPRQVVRAARSSLEAWRLPSYRQWSNRTRHLAKANVYRQLR